jgi:hypothetical protein
MRCCPRDYRATDILYHGNGEGVLAPAAYVFRLPARSWYYEELLPLHEDRTHKDQGTCGNRHCRDFVNGVDNRADGGVTDFGGRRPKNIALSASNNTSQISGRIIFIGACYFQVLERDVLEKRSRYR